MAEEVVVDLTNYKDRVGQRVMPGRYRVVVEDVEVDQSRAGNTMINTWLRIVGGEFDGAVVVDRMTLTEKAMFRIVGFMQAIGMKTPKKRFRIDVRQFVGKTLDVDLEDGEPYNGRIKSEVRGFMRILSRDGDDAPDDLDGLEEFAPKPQQADEVAGDDHSATEPTGSSEEVERDRQKAKQSATPEPERGAVADTEIDLDSLEL